VVQAALSPSHQASADKVAEALAKEAGPTPLATRLAAMAVLPNDAHFEF
jgi:hypothetical protein